MATPKARTFVDNDFPRFDVTVSTVIGTVIPETDGLHPIKVALAIIGDHAADTDMGADGNFAVNEYQFQYRHQPFTVTIMTNDK